ncbi:helix-turn-helix transcriptional regulator [Micromonospora sp. NPDC049275]|uniref:helix-turn-helix transcriptional regulator n=1 Tax=Micromonospora sp. NPDC049275 TaxID=3364268 RepID=UPI003717BAF4
MWTHEEAARYLGVQPQTLYYMNYKGNGPKSYKVGKYRRYRRRDIDTWLEAHSSER